MKREMISLSAYCHVEHNNNESVALYGNIHMCTTFNNLLQSDLFQKQFKKKKINLEHILFAMLLLLKSNENLMYISR